MLYIYLIHMGAKNRTPWMRTGLQWNCSQNFHRLLYFHPSTLYAMIMQLLLILIGLMYTLELLCRCDIIYFSGDWMNSLGCTTEYLQSKAMGIEQVTSVAELEQRLEHMEPGKNRNNRNRHPINLLYVRKLIDHAKDLLWQEKQ
ncbi:hypothetical protein ACFCTO_05780 [Megasphaera indica]